MSAEEIQRIERQLDKLFGLARTSADRQAEMAVAVARIEERLSARRECPAPGMCLDLKKSVGELSAARAQILGGWNVLATIGAAIMAILALVLEYLRK
jgi:hypothetical protein